MGAADEAIVTVDLSTATKKERQFQVVPVPGHFTRGRWKCWDYKDDKTQQQTDEKEKDTVEVSTIIITASATMTPELPPLSQEAIAASETTPIKEKESSTIVVTSIAPHPPSVHGTPVGLRAPEDMERMMMINSQLSHTVAEAATASGQQHVIVGVPSEVHIQQVAVVGLSSTPPPPSTVASVTTMVSRSDGTPPDGDESVTSAEQKTPNIDNKIEQAMDLVKTHLTFAVREEIDYLRNLITELENKVTTIETENMLLRQYAPAHVVAELPKLVNGQKESQKKAAEAATRAAAAPSASTSTVAPPVPTKISPSSFCTASFANTLNNVVADVRQQIRNQNPNPAPQ